MNGIRRLRIALAGVLLRRTKDSMSELRLPEKTIEVCKLQMPPESRDVYDTLLKPFKLLFGILLEHDAVLKNYTAVLEVIMRLRQICDSERLVPPERIEAAREVLKKLEKSHAEEKKLTKEEAEELLHQLRKDLQTEENVDNMECCICFEDVHIEDARIIRTCKHTFCVNCTNKLLQEVYNGTRCPLCRAEFSKVDIVDHSTLQSAIADKEDKEEIKNKPIEDISKKRKRTNENVKLQYLVQTVVDMPSDEKAVVFSCFTSFLDIAEDFLSDAGISFARIDGTMTLKNRKKSQTEFSKDDIESPKVLLVSLKAGGTGLNLTRGSTVFLLDLWWNESVQQQAMDRVHRIGQSRPVTVKILVTENTLEENILALQERKTQIATGALSNQKQASEERLNTLTRLLD